MANKKQAAAGAGYSGTPLARKLGIEEHARLTLVAAPPKFGATLEPLPEGVRTSSAARGERDVILFFARTAKELDARLAKLAGHLASAGGLWVAWPKKASGVATDLSFEVVQRAGLALGLVDNKVCAVDETWSGLRFVIRVADRPKKRSDRGGAS